MEINNGGVQVPPMEMNSPKELLRKMFESQTGEWTMAGNDGIAFKFHKDVLAEQIPRFRTLLAHQETTTENGNQKLVVLPAELEMGSVAVEQFLRFVYYQDADIRADDSVSFKIVCGLVRAGHYFNMPTLVQLCANQIHINRLRAHWFSVEELWKLFQYVRLWEDADCFKGILIEDIVVCLKRSFITEGKHKLSPVAGENAALTDLMIALSKDVTPTLIDIAKLVRSSRGTPSPGQLVRSAGGNPSPGQLVRSAGGHPSPSKLFRSTGGSPCPSQLFRSSMGSPSSSQSSSAALVKYVEQHD